MAVLDDKSNICVLQPEEAFVTETDQKNKLTVDQADMKAFVVERYGKDGLCATRVPVPTIGPRDVLVRVKAASINPLDMLIRDGTFKLVLKYKTPFVLGHDVAGVVTQVGADVPDYKVGDEVYARPRDLRIGTLAEYIAIDHADIALKPNSLTMEEAAAVPLVALAAWQMLVDVAKIQPGQKVLVHAGAGGLGSTVIQLAKHLGAYVATTARGSDEEKVRDLGADEVIDYTKADFAALLSGYDVVIDSIGGDTLTKSLAVLKRGGLAISAVRSAGRCVRRPGRPPGTEACHGADEPQDPGAGEEVRRAPRVLLHVGQWRRAEDVGRSLRCGHLASGARPHLPVRRDA